MGDGIGSTRDGGGAGERDLRIVVVVKIWLPSARKGNVAKREGNLCTRDGRTTRGAYEARNVPR